MIKITIVVPDDKQALVKALVEAITDMEIVEIKDMDSIEEFQRKSPLERLNYAIRGMVAEKIMENLYDYAWLYAAIQQKQLKGIEKFHSVDSFRQHLINIGIKKVPSNSTISDKYNCLCQRHVFPDWVFSDCDATETQRRINIAKRFLSLYYKGK